jgi:hypothetical protein
MMILPDENTAIDNSVILIKYAAESPKQLDESILTPIVQAWAARAQNTWSAQMAASFWSAYSNLCDFMKPVTLDTIACNKDSITQRKWIIFGPKRPISLAQRSVNNFLLLLGALLLFAIVLGYVNSSVISLTADINALLAKGDKLAPQISADMTTISAQIATEMPNENPLKVSLDNTKLKEETRTKITALWSELQDMYYVDDQMASKVRAISKLTMFSGIDYTRGDLSRVPDLLAGYSNVQSYYVWRARVADIQANSFIFGGFYTAIVPMLLGAIGACTYVLRMASDQIREVSFSPTSPLRHFVRIILGAMGGVAVGIGLLGHDSTLPATALAFLAGYAVEPVFSTLDGIAQKFKSG